LAPFAVLRPRPWRGRELGLGGKLCNQTQNSPTIPKKYAQLLKIIVRKIRQDGKINPVLDKAVRIVRQAMRT
jgi:hypothetical protein